MDEAGDVGEGGAVIISELRKAAEYVRDNPAYWDGENYEGTPNQEFEEQAKKLAEAWLAFVGDSTRQVSPNDYRYPSQDEVAEAEEILRSMGLAGYRPSRRRNQ